jgi:hypothetical protein
MAVFFLIGFVGAVLTSLGALLGETQARRTKFSRRFWSILGASTTHFLAVAVWLLLVTSEIPHIGWGGYLLMCQTWVAHWFLTSIVAGAGIVTTFEPHGENVAHMGAFGACFFSIPFTCWPLILLTLF